MARFSIDQIREELKPESWDILSTKYKNLDSELIFQCPEGHEVFNTWRRMRTRRECPICNQSQFKENGHAISTKGKKEYRLLSLDQATHITGWALFSNGKLIDFGIFETKNGSEIERDIEIKNWFINMIKNYEPDFVAFEEVQYNENRGSLITFATLARLQGILMSTAHELKVEYVVCSIPSWRNYCGVKGRTRADQKRSMQLLVKKWYDRDVSDDCADAIGIGYYAVTKSRKPRIENWE